MSDNALIGVITAATLAVGVAAYSLNVSGFQDYEPPNTLMIQWYDYYDSQLHNSASSNNSVTDFPRWSADFPYRACFYGGRYIESGMQYSQGYEANVIWIHSKKPVTDAFTFEYIPDNRNNGTRTGYIRASFNKSLEYGSYVVGGSGGIEYYDINISQETGAEGIVSPLTGHISFIPTYTPGLLGREANGKYYFEFDFMYDCLDKHQTNAQNLTVSGAKSVSGVPYPYILTCDAHGSGGASSGGGGSSSVGGVPDWDGGEISRPESFPDDELDNPWNPGESSSSSLPPVEASPIPEYGNDEGDTGEDGGGWQLPNFDFGNDFGVSGEIDGYKELKPGTDEWGENEIEPGIDNWGYEEMKPGTDDWGVNGISPGVNEWGYAEWIPDGEYGLVDFMK